jgi:hypothetical protein
MALLRGTFAQPQRGPQYGQRILLAARAAIALHLFAQAARCWSTSDMGGRLQLMGEKTRFGALLGPAGGGHQRPGGSGDQAEPDESLRRSCRRIWWL